jgi:hypothetical protein
MNKLNRFYLSQNISIDNALSMNQILHQIVNQIKEIVDFINNLELRANEYTDQEIIKLNDKLQAQLETLEQTLKTYTADSIDTYNVEIINPQLTEIRNTIDTLNRTLNARIDDEVGVLNRRISSVESTLNKKIDDTKEYLEELIRKGNQLVYSSISGRKIPIQDTLFEMGNALKQILSYNWNSIDEFKNYQTGFEEILSDYYISNVGYSGQEIYTKGVKISDIPLDESNEKTLYLEYNCPSMFDSLNIGDTTLIGYCGSNSIDSLVNAQPNGTVARKLSSNKVAITNFAGSILDTSEYLLIGIYFFNGGTGQMQRVFETADLDKVKLYYGNGLVESKITFNSIQLAMQELNVNWNALAFTGVNTFYELNETEKMFDTLGVKSDYFANDKYKQVHNNFESDFFKSNIN